MCTRFYIDPSPELRPIIEAASRSRLCREMVSKLGIPFKSSGEIRASDMAAVIAPSKAGKRSCFPMVWGYHIDRLKGPVVNARVETAKSKPNFSDGWAHRRCIIPASYYFEWEHFVSPNGQVSLGSKYIIQPRGAAVTYLAGLYRMEESEATFIEAGRNNPEKFRYPVFVVLTREASRELRRLHDRMPLVLPPEQIDSGLTPPGILLKSQRIA